MWNVYLKNAIRYPPVGNHPLIFTRGKKNQRSYTTEILSLFCVYLDIARHKLDLCCTDTNYTFLRVNCRLACILGLIILDFGAFVSQRIPESYQQECSSLGTLMEALELTHRSCYYMPAGGKLFWEWLQVGQLFPIMRVLWHSIPAVSSDKHVWCTVEERMEASHYPFLQVLN